MLAPTLPLFTTQMGIILLTVLCQQMHLLHSAAGTGILAVAAVHNTTYNLVSSPYYQQIYHIIHTSTNLILFPTLLECKLVHKLETRLLYSS